MAKWKKHFFWFIPILILGSIIGIYLFISSQQKVKNDNLFNQTNNNSFYEDYDFFPELTSYDFYSYLEVEEGEAKIGKAFVTQVLKKVIDQITIIEGTLSYEIINWTNSTLVITFLVSANNQEYWQTYYFNTNLEK